MLYLCTIINTNTFTMKVTLNTNVFPIIRVGMYNTNISSDEIFDDNTIIDDKENGYIHFTPEYFWDNFKNDLYVKRISELASDYLNGKHEFNGVEVTIKCKNIFGPREYNFATDELVLDVSYNKRKLLKFAKDNREDFDTFLHKNYTSYDGFMSFTANNYDEWLVDFKDNEFRSIGAVLSYAFRGWEHEYENTFDCYVREQIGYDYSEFVDYEDHDAEVVILETYVKDNYTDINVDSIDYDSFEFEILDIDSCKKIVNDVIEKIESHTLPLF